MDFFDSVPVSGIRKTADGYAVASARFARTGIYIYNGDQVGRPELDKVRVFRPETEVFDRDAMASFAHRPVTIGHPEVPVTPSNWSEHAVGTTDGQIARDGEYVTIPMILMDAEAINVVDGGIRELSAGYTCDLDWTAGTTEGGEEYDAVQRSIRGNHLAIVSAGRAGSKCKIVDNTSKGDQVVSNLKTIVVDGLSVDMTDQAAQVVERQFKALDGKIVALEAAVSAKDGEIAALDEKHKKEVDDLKSKVMDDASIHKAVLDRMKLIDAARIHLGDQDLGEMSNYQIQSAVVSKVLGNDKVDGKDAAFVSAAFDTLAALPSTSTNTNDGAAHVDPVRQAFANGVTNDAGGGGVWGDKVFQSAGVAVKSN